MKSKAEIIDPREAGQRHQTLKAPVFDEGALARADKTLEAMSGSFEEWLQADIEKLQDARMRAERFGWSDAGLDTLWRVAHDLKGMGTTYGYPIVTQIASSLCRLIETDAGKAAAREDTTLTCAHVDSLRAAVRDHISSTKDPLGKALAEALEARVARLGVAPR